MLDVQRLPRRSFWRTRVRRSFFRHGRVAESGLRHSTRNRAWGNPPWVRIPPLPPVFLKVAACASRKVFSRSLILFHVHRIWLTVVFHVRPNGYFVWTKSEVSGVFFM